MDRLPFLGAEVVGKRDEILAGVERLAGGVGLLRVVVFAGEVFTGFFGDEAELAVDAAIGVDGVLGVDEAVEAAQGNADDFEHLEALIEAGGLLGGFGEETANLNADEFDLVGEVDGLDLGEVGGIGGEQAGGIEAVLVGVFVAGLAAAPAVGWGIGFMHIFLRIRNFVPFYRGRG